MIALGQEFVVGGYRPGFNAVDALLVGVSEGHGFSSPGIVSRFLSLMITASDFKWIHGTNERIAVRHYEEAIRLDRELMLNTAGR